MRKSPQLKPSSSGPASSSFFQPSIIQTKLKVGQQNDKYEQEADAVADRVVGMGNAKPQLSAAEKIQRASAGAKMNTSAARGMNDLNVPANSIEPQLTASRGKGQALDATTQSTMESAIGFDFSQVRIHDNAQAIAMNQTLHSRAFTNGSNIYFNKGELNTSSVSGKKLLAHELTHVTQQTGNNMIQKLGIDDVASEMNGRVFTVVEAEGAIAVGTQITITDWGGTDSQAVGYYINSEGIRIGTAIRKHKLAPVNGSGANVRTYETGLSGQRSSVNRSITSVASQQTEVDAWTARRGSYSSNPEAWEAGLTRLETELTRRQGLLDRRQAQMSRMLVRETMYNRFDGLIATWVSHYNTEFSPAVNLDPNVVKSLIFQETRMGTSGVHLQLPPYEWTSLTNHPLKSRFNLGQTIDSWGPQQYLMIKEMAPEIYTRFGLDALEAQAAWRGMTNTEYAEFESGAFVSAIQEFFAHRDGGNNFMGNSGMDLHEDYEFWIRATVRWLFLKYQSLSTPSWSEAVRAYNGSGASARAYRDDVIGRTGSQTNLNVGNN